jgi:hypothetical protein
MLRNLCFALAVLFAVSAAAQEREVIDMHDRPPERIPRPTQQMSTEPPGAQQIPLKTAATNDSFEQIYASQATRPHAQRVKQLLDQGAGSQELKARAWDAFYASEKYSDFYPRFASIEIGEWIKARLWDVKYGNHIVDVVGSTSGFPSSPTAAFPASPQSTTSSRPTHTERPASAMNLDPYDSLMLVLSSPSHLDIEPEPIVYPGYPMTFPWVPPPQRQVHCSTWTDGMTGSINCY